MSPWDALILTAMPERVEEEKARVGGKIHMNDEKRRNSEKATTKKIVQPRWVISFR